jgi:hypothetical protein
MDASSPSSYTTIDYDYFDKQRKEVRSSLETIRKDALPLLEDALKGSSLKITPYIDTIHREAYKLTQTTASLARTTGIFRQAEADLIHVFIKWFTEELDYGEHKWALAEHSNDPETVQQCINLYWQFCDFYIIDKTIFRGVFISYPYMYEMGDTLKRKISVDTRGLDMFMCIVFLLKIDDFNAFLTELGPNTDVSGESITLVTTDNTKYAANTCIVQCRNFAFYINVNSKYVSHYKQLSNSIIDEDLHNAAFTHYRFITFKELEVLLMDSMPNPFSDLSTSKCLQCNKPIMLSNRFN